MNRMRSLGLGCIFVAVFVVGLGLGQPVVVPTYRDVSGPVGLLRLGQTDRRRPTLNKYWGSSIVDVDRDGRYDLLLSNHGNNAEWYWSQGQARFQYMNPRLALRDIHSTCALDMDNDNVMDVIFTRGGKSGKEPAKPVVFDVSKDRTWTRDEGQKFRIATKGMRGRSISALDMNGDGYLDLLYVNQRNISATSAHLMYRNLRNGKFAFTPNVGIERVNALWFKLLDVNGDGWMDIILMAFDRVELWLGTGAFKFRRNVGMIPGWKTMSNVRCIAEFDMDGDGDMDLYFARGARHKPFPDVLLERRKGVFVNIAEKAGIAKLSGRHFHVSHGDFNNDGYEDLYITRVTFFNAPRLRDLMLLNRGDGTFKVAPRHGTEPPSRREDGDSSGVFDYDMDGRLDILTGNLNATWRLYKNQTPQNGNHWVIIRVGTPLAGHFRPWLKKTPLGALVKVFCKDRVFVKRVDGHGSSHSQSYMDTLHFGLGTCNRILRISVKYVGGVTVSKGNFFGVDRVIEVGQYWPCPRGFIGKQCTRRIPQCRDGKCPQGMRCETLLNRNYYCPI
ncbi:hypothetical protein NDN08_007099 [Rhodosorus marinus]|uniref:ASPIC/UnbV domain-containing protein n=1 Tax=Rhodosorus marinus TaxID=101924 RepID=A0AAV8UFJ1_9RHOD|nr:hypothetical protein NDN08_007099 [Rhodosorus marinus]